MHNSYYALPRCTFGGAPCEKHGDVHEEVEATPESVRAVCPYCQHGRWTPEIGRTDCPIHARPEVSGG